MKKYADLIKGIGVEIDRITNWLEILEQSEVNEDDASEIGTNAVDLFIATKEAKKEFDAVIAEIQGRCKDVISEIATTTGRFEFHGTLKGKSFLTSPYVRVTYKSSAMEALYEANEEFRNLVKDARTETPIDGTLVIR